MQRVELRHKDAVIAEKEAEIGKLRATIAEYDATVNRQNSAVEGWKAAGIENARLAKLAEERAKSAQTQYRRQAQILLDAKIPHADQGKDSQESGNQQNLKQQIPENDPTCEDSLNWLRAQAPSLSW